MGEGVAIRKPKQKRSIEKKQQIVETAKALYTGKGYHGTTTNEIAKQAGVSIGTLYAYFPDKEAVLLEVVRQLQASFYAAFDVADAQEDTDLFRDDTRAWLSRLFESLANARQVQQALHLEIETLRYSVPGVAAALEEQEAHIQRGTLAVLSRYRADIACGDVEAASIIITDFAGALVRRVTQGQSPADRQRLMDAGIDALYGILKNERKPSP